MGIRITSIGFSNRHDEGEYLRSKGLHISDSDIIRIHKKEETINEMVKSFVPTYDTKCVDKLVSLEEFIDGHNLDKQAKKALTQLVIEYKTKNPNKKNSLTEKEYEMLLRDDRYRTFLPTNVRMALDGIMA